MGFVDKDMHNSDHDTIVEWIDENSERILLNILPRVFSTLGFHFGDLKYAIKEAQKYNTFPIDLEEKIQNYKQELDRLKNAKILGGRKNVQFNSSIWELPIKSRNFVIGFIDLFRSVSFDVENIINMNLDRYSFIKKTYMQKTHILTHPIHYPLEKTKEGKTGEEEEYEFKKPSLILNHYNYKVYFEAKTTIPSIGELMRQIQFYKTYIPRDRDQYTNKIGIVSYPNPRAQRIVESQGFFWIDYPGDKPKLKGQRTLI